VIPTMIPSISIFSCYAISGERTAGLCSNMLLGSGSTSARSPKLDGGLLRLDPTTAGSLRKFTIMRLLATKPVIGWAGKTDGTLSVLGLVLERV
jgi:hypothetical protein